MSADILASASLPAPTPTTAASPTTSSGWLLSDTRWDQSLLCCDTCSRLPLPLSPLAHFPPAIFTSYRETGSLLARAPLDCQEAARAEPIKYYGSLFGSEKTYQTPCEDIDHAFTMSSVQPVGDLLPRGSSSSWQGPRPFSISTFVLPHCYF